MAHVLLPIGTFAETSGTYVNLEGLWQSFAGAAQAAGRSRVPAGRCCACSAISPASPDFDYQSSEEVREELRALCGGVAASVVPGHARGSKVGAGAAMRA